MPAIRPPADGGSFPSVVPPRPLADIRVSPCYPCEDNHQSLINNKIPTFFKISLQIPK